MILYLILIKFHIILQFIYLNYIKKIIIILLFLKVK
jgi:hypothetical protein